MPDRYGEHPEPDRPDDLWASEIRNRQKQDCTLCDSDGYRGSIVCNHQDGAAAAQRGMAAVREAMGWTESGLDEFHPDTTHNPPQAPGHQKGGDGGSESL